MQEHRLLEACRATSQAYALYNRRRTKHRAREGVLSLNRVKSACVYRARAFAKALAPNLHDRFLNFVEQTLYMSLKIPFFSNAYRAHYVYESETPVAPATLQSRAERHEVDAAAVRFLRTEGFHVRFRRNELRKTAGDGALIITEFTSFIIDWSPSA